MSRDLSVAMAGLVLPYPVINCSGIVSIESQYDAEFYQVKKYGAYVEKSKTRHPRSGSNQPRTLEVPGGLINCIGLQNVGIEAFCSEHIRVVRQCLPGNVVYIVNIAGESIGEYVETAEILQDKAWYLFDALEVSISCTNVEKVMAFGRDPDLAYKLTKSIRSVFRFPMGVKLSPNVADIVPIAQAVKAGGADFISLINTVRYKAPIASGQNAGEWIEGGLSGPCIKPIALDLASQVSRAVDLPLIAMGGISNSQDALEFLRIPNVRAIGVGTALFRNPTAIPDIVRGLKNYMAKKNYTTLSELKEKETRG